jgi:DNA-binding HxlR family transcriptional regulator
VSARHLLRVQELLGRKWELLILTRLGPGPLRYKDLARQLREIDRGLNDGVLSRTLRRLTDDGLVHRQAIGNRHVHALTDLGRDIVTILAQITDLSDQPAEPDEPRSDERRDDPER